MNITELRAERNQRLGATDYLLLQDVFSRYSEGTRTQILEYRQELRDLPASYLDQELIEVVDWPLSPVLPT